MAKRAWPNRDGDWATKVAYREFAQKCLGFVEGGERPAGPNGEYLSDKVVILAAADAFLAAAEAAAAEAAEAQEDAKGN